MRRLMLAALLTAALFAPRAARAQDDPRKVQAAPFFEEARKLAEKGQNAESLEKFKKAYAIYPSPNTQFNVARQEQLLGQRLAALRDYREALRNPVLLPQVAEMARGYVAELERAVGRVKIVGPEGARVSVAGNEYTLPLADPIDVEPGTISIQGSRGDERFSTTAEATAGAIVTVTLGPKSSPTPITDDHPGPIVSGGSNATRNIVAGSLAVVGLVGIGLGVGFTLGANSASDDLARAKAETGGDANNTCTTTRSAACDTRGQAADDLARDTNIARAMYIAGGAALVGGVVAFLVWPTAKASSSTSGTAGFIPWVGAGTAGFSYGREF